MANQNVQLSPEDTSACGQIAVIVVATIAAALITMVLCGWRVTSLIEASAVSARAVTAGEIVVMFGVGICAYLTALTKRSETPFAHRLLVMCVMIAPVILFPSKFPRRHWSPDAWVIMGQFLIVAGLGYAAGYFTRMLKRP